MACFNGFIAYVLEIFIAGGIWDGIEIFIFLPFLLQRAGGTLTALREHVSRRMEDLTLWHELSYIEVQYVSWHWDVRLSLESYVGVKAIFHKKALGVHCCSLGPQKESASHHFKENCVWKCLSEGNQCIFASNLCSWWHLRWNGNFHILAIFAWWGESGLWRLWRSTWTGGWKIWGYGMNCHILKSNSHLGTGM